MSDISRRQAITLAAAGAGVLLSQPALAQEEPATAAPATPQKTLLEMAQQSPQSFMFADEVVFKVKGDGHSRDLVITSAIDILGQKTVVPLRTGTMAVFLIDPDKDDFTKKGGFYWRFFGTEGKTQFKDPGEHGLVMVVREHNDTVRCYSLVLDFRC